MDKVTGALEENWNSYTAAFGASAEDERDRLLEQCVSDDVIFTNPGGEGKSRAGLSAHIGNFQKSMPGARFDTEKIFVHHGELLAIWSLYKQDGAKVATGYNFVRPGQDGRFDYMAGFF
jgi:SnoaL-like domain